MRNLIIILTVLCLGACASTKPVIYQSKKTARVGEQQLQQDINSCRAEAESKGLDPTRSGGTELASETVKGGAMGGAVGAATGAIGGNAGHGAKYGAAAGATASFLRNIFKGAKPNSTYRRYVERCLADLGYDVVGWD